MLIFFTVVFVAYYLISVVKGKPFKSLIEAIGEDDIRKQREGSDNYKMDKDLVLKMLLTVFLFMIPFVVIQLIYLCNALNDDPYKYPTLSLLAYYFFIIVWIAVKGKKKRDLSTDRAIEKYRKTLKKNRTVKGTLISLAFLVYFIYMLIVLAF